MRLLPSGVKATPLADQSMLSIWPFPKWATWVSPAAFSDAITDGSGGRVAAGVAEGRGAGVTGRGETSAVTVGGAVVALFMIVASAGGLVVETIGSCSLAQAARERKRRMSITCRRNR